eukprot:gene824-828_t
MNNSRLAALRSYHILDTVEEDDFDHLTALTAAIFQVPISTVSLVDEKRQWFKSHFGIANRENPIEYSFCAHAIQTPDEVMIIENAKADERFVNNPLVLGDPNILFYAGVPLVTSAGEALGTLCIIDREPRKLSQEQIIALKILGSQVMDKLELRKNNYELSHLNEELAAANKKLKVSEENLIRMANELEERVSERTVSLQETNQRLEIALNAGKFGSYELDLPSGKMICTDQCKINYGQPVDQDFNFSDLLATVEPVYRDYLRTHLNDAITHKSIFSAQYQIRWPDDSLHWMTIFGKPQYDEQGNTVKLFGVSYDISQQKEIDAKKDIFIGMVSHELKTPLTSLSAIIQMAGAKLKQNGDIFLSGAMDKAHAQARKMGTMINGFLNVSRLESGKIEIIKKPFYINELVQEMIDESASVQSTHVIYFDPCKPMMVNADRDKIGSVISNLISNAIKYSPKGKKITISCQQLPKTVMLLVKDEGLGIKPEDMKRLFDRYYRVEANNQIAGFGIGLYLSAEIIRYHNGEIGVDSEPGIGSVFYFTLPMA